MFAFFFSHCFSRDLTVSCNLGFPSESVNPAVYPTRTKIKQTEHLVTLSDTRDTAGIPQGIGQSKPSGVWIIVKRLNDERIKVDHNLREEEEAEIRRLLNKQVIFSDIAVLSPKFDPDYQIFKTEEVVE